MRYMFLTSFFTVEIYGVKEMRRTGVPHKGLYHLVIWAWGDKTLAAM